MCVTLPRFFRSRSIIFRILRKKKTPYHVVRLLNLTFPSQLKNNKTNSSWHLSPGIFNLNAEHTRLPVSVSISTNSPQRPRRPATIYVPGASGINSKRIRIPKALPVNASGLRIWRLKTANRKKCLSASSPPAKIHENPIGVMAINKPSKLSGVLDIKLRTETNKATRRPAT